MLGRARSGQRQQQGYPIMLSGTMLPAKELIQRDGNSGVAMRKLDLHLHEACGDATNQTNTVQAARRHSVAHQPRPSTRLHFPRQDNA